MIRALAVLGLAASVAACSSNEVQTGLLVGTSIAQNALTVYAANPRANPTIVKVATDLVNAEPALEGAYTSSTVPKAQAIALAIAAVNTIAADDPKPAITQAAPFVNAGLNAVLAGGTPTSTQLISVGTMVSTWLLDKALQS